jgi:polysaccharide chain length determinant protein (PEP-CTERM system associated)
MAFFRPQSLRDYLQLARRLLMRKWLILVVAASVTAAIGLFVMRMPRTYTSSALVLIEPGGIDPTRAPSHVNIEGRLRSLRPMLTSRTTLETIIEDLNLYPDRRAADVMDKVIDYMRRYVQVKVSGRDSFQVTFTHPNPKTAQEVTDRLSRILINRSVSEDVKGARERVDFLRKQTDRLRQEVKGWNDKIQQFLADNPTFGGLEGANIVSPIGVLGEQLKAVDANLNSAQDRRVALQAQLGREKGGGGGVGSDPAVRAAEQKVAAARTKLRQLERVNTAQHPDVISAREEVAGAEAELEVARKSYRPSANPGISAVQGQLTEVDLEIKSLRRERDRLMKEIDEARAQARINPVLKAQHDELQRERQRVEEELNKVSQNLKQAEYDSQVLESEKGEQFRIQDWANLPQAPDPPGRALLLVVAGVLGLLAGFGVALVVVYFDQAVYNDYELSRVTDLPVLVSIPRHALPGPSSERADGPPTSEPV